MSNYENAFSITVGNEGNYSNNPNDSGGETKYGITEKVARENGYYGPMIDMPLSFAHKVYKSEYWDKLNLDSISNISTNVANEMFDTGVNMGIVEAGKILQRCLNVLNNMGSIYPDITLDGVIGQQTINALTKYINYRKSDSTLYVMMNCLQGSYYVDLAEKREKDETFIYGWFSKRVKI